MLTRSLALAFLTFPATAQQFVRNTADVPLSTGDTEQIDFADIDLDGDWDAGHANGGDSGNQFNSLWVNLGGAQSGVLGVFADRTIVQFPSISDASRDIEFADYDGDGDPDIAIANDSTILNQPSRFWTNRGGAQGGTIGTYVDQTVGRWVGLGAPGSSIPPAQLIGGGFIDFPNDIDFADFDSDGDLDLVHVTWGAAASGNAPTRIFRNDGAGYFSEFNPSGFQLTGLGFPEGSPGLWCEGTQAANTTNATGVNCDIATSALNADWGDIDGDLDLDLLLGSRQELPRMFQNRLSENLGLPGFRDVTGTAFVTGYSTSNGHYEECFGDFDGDDDLDIYGVNWHRSGSDFPDTILRNGGTGYFAEPFNVPQSTSDDNSADPIDYDLDGDLDIYVANWSGLELMVRTNAGWTFTAVTTGVLPFDSTRTLDGDAADVDGDGDYDLFDANGGNQPEWYKQNTGTATDVTAPRIARLEQAANRVPGPVATVVRCQVYDNTPLQITQWFEGELELIVNNVAIPSVALRSSFGQIFRAEIPGTLAGVIEYRASLADEHGNVGVSPWLVYTSTDVGALFCSGDGSGTPCPCGNDASVGRGCGNSLGAGSRLTATGVAVISNDTLVLEVFPVPNSSVLFFQGTTQVNGGAGSVFGDGLRCAGGSVTRLATKTAASNLATYPTGADVPVSVRGAVPPTGGVRTYQAWYRNAADYCTPSTFNLSNGWQVNWLP